MTPDDVGGVLREALEALAAKEHERWAHWQRYLHSKAEQQSDGSLLLPASLVAQWETQIATPYGNLSDIKKESDRDQVLKYLPIIETAFKKRLIGG